MDTNRTKVLLKVAWVLSAIWILAGASEVTASCYTQTCENSGCMTCRWFLLGTECFPVNQAEGRCTCRECFSGTTTSCSAWGEFCFGVIVDLRQELPDETKSEDASTPVPGAASEVAVGIGAEAEEGL